VRRQRHIPASGAATCPHASLGLGSGALLAALARLREDPPVVNPDLIREVAGIRDLASAVARLVDE